MARKVTRKVATKKVTSISKRTVGAARSLARSAKRVVTAVQRKPPVRKSATGTQQDAVALLRADHKRLRQLLTDLKGAQTPARRQRVFEQVQDEVKAHTTIEEELFYPAFREAAQTKKDRQMFHEATEEHHAADLVLKETGGAMHEPDVFAARAKVLKELIEHHAEEEETDMFPRARKLLPPPELRRLGEEMAARKRTMTQPSALRAMASFVGIS